MKKNKQKIMLGVTLVACLTANVQAEQASWAYSGVNGPEKWGELSPEYDLCRTGKNQSPVNIDATQTLPSRKNGIKFNYGLLNPDSIQHTGQYIQINVAQGANVTVGDKTFSLEHLQLHMPSEHTVNGKHFPVELQFIHSSADNEGLTVSRMFVPGRPDRTLAMLMESLPPKNGGTASLPDNALRNLEMKKKLANYYYYSGSMTTPPCTEGMRWYIMQDTLTLSSAQQQAFLHALGQNNNRPLQPLNARMVLK